MPEKRTANSRTYRNTNGSFTTEFFSQQLHYKDSAGRIRPIDTSLEADTDGYSSDENALKADFGRGGSRLVGLTKSDDPAQKISFGPLDAKEPLAPAKRNSQSVRYSGYKEGIDLDYIVTPGRIKEGIVISRPTSETVFVFQLALEGLVPKSQADGSIALIDKETNKPSVIIESPYMTDAKASQAGLMPEQYTSWDCTMSITSARAGIWRLVVTVDEAWLADPDRAWPVVVDPTFSVASGAVADTYLRQDNPTGTYHTATNMTCGSLGPSKAIRDLVKFDISAIPQSAQITTATLNLPSAPGSSLNIDDYAGQTTTNLLRVSANWDTSACWNNMAYNYDPSIIATSSSESPAFGVTDLVSDWHSGAKPNYGFMLSNAGAVKMIDDEVPAGATQVYTWNWATTTVHSGTKRHYDQSASGTHDLNRPGFPGGSFF